MNEFPKMLYGETVEVQLIVESQDEQDDASAAGWKTAEEFFSDSEPAKKRTRRTKEQIAADEAAENQVEGA